MKINVPTCRHTTTTFTIYCRRRLFNSSFWTSGNTSSLASGSAPTIDVCVGERRRQQFGNVFNQLALSNNVEEFRRQFNETAHLLTNNVSIDDQSRLLSFFYGSVVHRCEYSFAKFLDRWWREIHPFLGRSSSMDVGHVATILYYLGRINCRQNLVVRRRLTRNDVRHCEQRLMSSLSNGNDDDDDDGGHLYNIDSWVFRRGTCGLVDLMLPTDIDYPSEKLVTLLMDYISTTINLRRTVSKTARQQVDDEEDAIHLADCSYVVLNLTLMGIRVDDSCFRRIAEALKTINFLYVPRRNDDGDRRVSPKILSNLMEASEKFAQSCSLASVNADEITPQCWTSWLMDCEGQLHLVKILLTEKTINGDVVMSNLKRFLLRVLEIAVKYERTREFVDLFDVWFDVFTLVMDGNNNYLTRGPFLPLPVIREVVKRLNIFAARAKKLNLIAPSDTRLEELLGRLNDELLDKNPNWLLPKD